MKKRIRHSFHLSATVVAWIAVCMLGSPSDVEACSFNGCSPLLLAAARKSGLKASDDRKTKSRTAKSATRGNADGLPAKIGNMRREADRLLMDVRDVSAARRAYKRTLAAIDRNDPYYNIDIQEINVALAMCDAADGNFEAAERVFRKEYESSLKRRGSDVAKWYALLSMCEAAGRDFKFSRSTAKDIVIADCLMPVERYADAEKLYARSLGTIGISNDAKAYVLMQWAECLAKMGRHKDALKQYQALQKGYKTALCAPRAMLRAGVLCVGHLDNDKLGCDFFKFIEDTFPASEFAEQALFYRLTVAIWDKKWDDAKELRKLFAERHPSSSRIKIVQDEYGQLIAKKLTALPDK